MTTTGHEGSIHPEMSAAPDRARGFGRWATVTDAAAWKPIFVVYASVPLAVIAIVWLAGDGHLGSTPIWVLVAILAITSFSNLLSYRWLRRCPGAGVPLQVRLAVSAVTTAAVIYAAGWGSMLVIAYAVGIAEIVRTNGSATWRDAMAWNATSIIAGETAIALHWAPSILPIGTAHEAALFGFGCLAVVTRVLVLTSRTAELAEAHLRERSEQFESLVAHASDVIGTVDGAGYITFVSPAVETLLGYTPAQLSGTQLVSVIEPDDVDAVRRIIEELATGTGDHDRRDVRFRNRNGHEKLVVVTFTNRDSTGTGTIVINLHDVTVERELEARLRFDAMHDPLTGTWNRGAFNEALEMACAAGARDGETIALLFVDIDGFKQINDSLGHDRGDALLMHVARTIQTCLRVGDILGRWGGDEFVVLLSRVNADDEPGIVAGRILEELERATAVGLESTGTTVSIGVATSTNGAHSAVTLARLADEAMYAAKRSGRARWVASPDGTAAPAI